jgi:ATP-dependent helicase HrpA
LLREELARLAAKTRSRQHVLDDYAVYQFYDQRLPQEVCDRGVQGGCAR